MLVKLPWGDYVRDEAVSTVTIDRSDVGFVVCVSLDREGMEVRSPPYDTQESAEAGADRVARIIDPVFCH